MQNLDDFGFFKSPNILPSYMLGCFTLVPIKMLVKLILCDVWPSLENTYYSKVYILLYNNLLSIFILLYWKIKLSNMFSDIYIFKSPISYEWETIIKTKTKQERTIEFLKAFFKNPLIWLYPYCVIAQLQALLLEFL